MAAFDTRTAQLLLTVEDRVARITLNRPEARNALSEELTVALRRTLAWCAAEREIGAVLLTGADAAFCAGGDVKAMGSRNDNATAQPSLQVQFGEMVARHKEIAGALSTMSKPSVAALPGAAVGAGLAIALSCDVRIAGESAVLSTGYARIGLSGDYGIAWLLTRIVGGGCARQLMLTSERVSARRALEIGLVNDVVADSDLAATAFGFARSLAHGPQVAYGYIKRNLDEALTVDHATAIEREADRLLKARTTSDHREAVRAFAEKREPRFSGD